MEELHDFKKMFKTTKKLMKIIKYKLGEEK